MHCNSVRRRIEANTATPREENLIQCSFGDSIKRQTLEPDPTSGIRKRELLIDPSQPHFASRNHELEGRTLRHSIKQMRQG